MTRVETQRKKHRLSRKDCEPCPQCNGTKRISPVKVVGQYNEKCTKCGYKW